MAWAGRMLGSALVLLGLLPLPAPAATAVDLELVLAVDVSRSMDRDEQALQRAGYVAALRSDEVLHAVRAGMLGRIALVYVEWAGVEEQRVVVDWRLIADRADLDAFAAALATAAIDRRRYTSISASLAFANALFEANRFAGTRRVIDVSGDGPNNTGPPVAEMRDALVAAGVVVNGLPLMLRPYSSGVNNVLLDLETYYEDCVIGGPGAFLVTIQTAKQFEDAIRRKLVLEIAGGPARLLPTVANRKEPRVDCRIGEKTRPVWMKDP